MRSSFRFALPLALASLVFGGAGCLSFGASAPAAADGGVFRTSDAGSIWAAQTAVPTATGVGSLAGTNILAFANDPQDALIVYAATRENGLFFSQDGGTSWQRPRLDVLRDGAIASVAVDPKSTCTVYVAKGTHLFKTTDCLRSFASDTFVETRPKISITNVQVDWYNAKTIWLSESNGDVQKSGDAGKTWRRVLSARSSVSALAVSQTDSRIVVVGTASAGFFRTGDGGETWTQQQDQLKNLRGADTVFALGQDAKGAALIAATQYGLIRSRDVGGAWEPIQLLTTPGQVTIQALAVGPASADVIAYATAGTFYRSTDGGKNWTTHQLSSGRIPMSLIPDAKNPLGYLLGFAAPLKK